MKTIMLHGAYNGSNYGDFLLAWLIQERVYKNGFDTILNNASPYFNRLMGKNSFQQRKCINVVDGIIFGGGGYLATRRIGFRAIRLLLFTHVKPMIKAIFLKKPFIICGTGVGPIHDPILQFITVKALDRAKSIVVRNEESKQYLLKYGLNNDVNVCPDLALAFKADYIPTDSILFAESILKKYENKRKVFIHINLLNLRNNKNEIERGCDCLLHDLKTVADEHDDLLFVIGSDYISSKVDEMNKYIFNYLGTEKCILISNYDVWNLSALLSKMDVIITTKLHVGIVSTALGKTVISFSGDQKIHRFYKQIGAPDRSIELKDIKLGDSYKHIKKYLYAEPINITELHERANNALNQIDEFLSDISKK